MLQPARMAFVTWQQYDYGSSADNEREAIGQESDDFRLIAAKSLGAWRAWRYVLHSHLIRRVKLTLPQTSPSSTSRPSEPRIPHPSSRVGCCPSLLSVIATSATRCHPLMASCNQASRPNPNPIKLLVTHTFSFVEDMVTPLKCGSA